MKPKAKWIEDGKDWILVLVKNNYTVARLTRKPFSIVWVGQADFNSRESFINPTFIENEDLAVLQEIAVRICNVKVIHK